MKIDKFGAGALVAGLAILGVLLQVYFMGDGWTLAGLWSAFAAAVLGGALLIGVVLVVMGIMLLVL
jgi:hypothetical protein